MCSLRYCRPELLASGSVAIFPKRQRQGGYFRSAFYKYKDYVFDAKPAAKAITVIATLDKMALLPACWYFGSRCIGSLPSQSRRKMVPQVEVTMRTGTIQMTVEKC